MRFSVALKRSFEDELEGGQIPFEEESSVKEETGGIVDKGIETGSSHFAGAFGVGQPGSLEHIGLPQVVGIVGLEAVQIVPIREGEFSLGEASFLERPVESGSAQQSRGSQLHVLHDGDNALDGSFGHLELELAGLIDELLGDGPYALIGTGFVLEGLESAIAIESEPKADGLGLDVGHFSGLKHPGLAGQLFQEEEAFPPGRVAVNILRMPPVAVSSTARWELSSIY
jgi:hypothetical protein